MKKISIIFAITLVFILSIDFLFGAYLLKLTPKKIDHTTNHNVFDHNLKKNFKANLKWGPNETYLFCSDNNSFRNFCKNMDSNLKDFDIAFIGDSFTEGVGLDYKDTFVGKISNKFDNLKIANLGVVSYSPAIYFTKLKHLIENGYQFKRVIIFFDISDVYDDNRKYRLEDNIIVRKKSKLISNFQKSLKSIFPFLAYSTKVLKNDIFDNKEIEKSCNYLDFCHEKSSWTFNNEYFKSQEISKSFEYMEMTYNLLKENDIKMSVGIYPWPAQLMYDTEKSKIVDLMGNFCDQRCEFFFNNFPSFFSEIKTLDKKDIIAKYYLEGDVHFNILGNEVLFKNFIENFKY